MSDLLLNDLRAAIAARHAIVVVGTGVSRIATDNAPAAAWEGLLRLGVERCVDLGKADAGWADRRRADLASGEVTELLGVATQVASRLGAPDGGEYRSWLRETVGALKPVSRDVLDAVAGLGAPLATTNYDGLLEHATGMPAVTWQEGARVERVVRGDDAGILHLHGYWDAPPSVVLGISSYEDVLRSAHAQAVLRAMRMTRTLVFVGFGGGLGDPNFGALLKWSRTLFAESEYRQFRIVRESEVEEAKRQHPDAERLFVVSYGKDYADLAPFLRELAPPATAKSGLSGSSAPPPAPRALRLPPRPVCIGRDDLVADLAGELASSAPRPTAVLGGPGIGKSTVALAALHEAAVAARYGDRRYFTRCDATATGEALVGEIARISGVPLGPDVGAGLLAHLRAAPAALALDNLETPWEGDTASTEALLGELASIPGLALVAALRGQQRPLGVTWRAPLTVPPLPAADAERLFLSVAGERFRGDPHLAALLQALGGVPLAVELMAFVAESEPDLAGVWTRWQAERTQMLRRYGVRGALGDVEVSFELSVKGPRMDDWARRLLALLGMLPEGIAHGDLAALLPGEGAQAAATLRQVGLAFDERSRLLVLAPIREYVQRRYPADAADRQRAIAFYLNLATELGPKAGATGGAEAIRRLAPEWGNLETAIVLALESDEPRTAIVAAIQLAEFVRFSGLGTSRPLELAAAAAVRTKDENLRANCIKGLGEIALYRSDHDSARTRYEAALPLYRQVGNVLGEANCIQGLGDIALARSDHDAARARYEEAQPLYRQVGSVLGEAHTLSDLGDLDEKIGDLAAARARWAEAVSLYRRIENTYWAERYERKLKETSRRRPGKAATPSARNR